MVLFLILIVPAVKLTDPAVGFAVAALGGGTRGICFGASSMHVALAAGEPTLLPTFPNVDQHRGDGESLPGVGHRAAQGRPRPKHDARRDTDLQQVKLSEAKTIAESETLRDDRLRRINDIFAQRMLEIQTTQQTDMRRGDCLVRAAARWRSGPRTRPAPEGSTRNRPISRRRSRLSTSPRWNEAGRSAGGGGSSRWSPPWTRFAARLMA